MKHFSPSSSADFGQRKLVAKKMNQPPEQKNILDILHEYRDAISREIREICAQIEPLRERLAHNEVEFLKVNRALVAAGDTQTFRELGTPEQDGNADHREDSIRALAATIRDTPPSGLTIKGLLVRALIENSDDGASPAELKDKIFLSYGRIIDSGSIRPILARLREDGIVMRSIPPKWILDPRAARIMGSAYASGAKQFEPSIGETPPEFWDSPLIKAAQELAWRDDDGLTATAAAERLEESRLHRVATSDAAAKEIGPQERLRRPVARNGG